MQHGTTRKFALLIGLVAFAAIGGGCKKKVAAPPPAPAPAPPPVMPTVTLNASPTSVNAGQTVTLSWSSTNATDLEIQPGVGKVAPQGSTPVNPTESTTYTITATGAGGSATASAHVDVTAPPKAAPTPAPPSVSELFEQNVKDAFYDFDKSDVREDARAALTKDAEFLRSYPQVRVSIEGHCDERGSAEYNLALGQRRADTIRKELELIGVSANQIKTVSFGEEKPRLTCHEERCWKENRRVDFDHKSNS